jgi:hypothetical protein
MDTQDDLSTSLSIVPGEDRGLCIDHEYDTHKEELDGGLTHTDPFLLMFDDDELPTYTDDKPSDTEEEKEVYTNYIERNVLNLQRQNLSSVEMISRGVVPSFIRPAFCFETERLSLEASLIQIIDTHREGGGESFKNTHSLEAFFTYIYLLLDNSYHFYVSETRFEYLLSLCDANHSNTCLIACMLPIFCRELTSRARRYGDLYTKFYHFLVRLTLFHNGNHACWASTLTEVWDGYMNIEAYRVEIVKLFCENTLFSEAFTDLLQCKVEQVYRYKSDFPDIDLLYRTKFNPGQFCVEILHYNLFITSANKHNEESARVCAVTNMYIPYIYTETGEVRNCSAIVKDLLAEREQHKSSNKR